VAEELSPDRVRISVEVGSQVNPTPFVSGRLLIAFLEPQAQAAFLDADADYQAMGRAKREHFHVELKAIRRQGLTMMDSIVRIGTDLAVIVGNPETGVTATLAVPFVAGGQNHGREKELVPVVQDCAAQITRALGLTPALLGQSAPAAKA